MSFYGAKITNYTLKTNRKLRADRLWFAQAVIAGTAG